MDELRELRHIFSDLPALLVVSELEEFLVDLQEAHDLLDLAVEVREGGAGRVPARSFDSLVGSAIVAYWRCFTVGKRRGLDSLVPIPADLEQVHERSRLVRNRAVAHADSDRLTSVATLTLSRQSGELKFLGTSRAVLARGVGMEFENMRSLVSRMILETQAALEKAEFDVQTVLSHMDLETLWDSPEIDLGGEVIDLFVAMDPNSHRRVVEGTFRVGSNVHAMSDPLIQELIRKALEGEIEASSLVQPTSDSTSP